MRSTAATRDCAGWLEKEKISYVLAVACDEMIAVAAATCGVPMSWRSWSRRSAWAAAELRRRGPRGRGLYDWVALIETASADHWLLARRSLHPGEKGDLEAGVHFLCYSPRPVTLPELVAVAGARWAVEEDCFAGGEERGPAWTTTRSASTAPMKVPARHLVHAGARSVPSPSPALRARRAEPGRARNRSLPAGTPSATSAKEGVLTPVDNLFAPPRTYSPPPVITDQTRRAMIPLTAAETRRLFNLYTRVIRP